MAKLYKLGEDTQNLIDKIVTDTGLYNYINVMTFGSKQKEVIKVKKASPTEEGIGSTTDSIIVYVNEDVFTRLNETQQEILMRDILNGVSFDDEKSKLIVTQPEIKVSVGGWRKYGEELINAAEVAIMVREQLEEEEKERKAAEKEAKKKK